jgi:hypothetical protein
VGHLGAHEEHAAGVRAGGDARAAADAFGRHEGAVGVGFGTGVALASGADAGVDRDEPAGLDDAVERRCGRRRGPDDREGVGPPRLDGDRLAVRKLRMCSWQVVVFSGPCASPEIIRPHMPQMPSRQSLSKATGSSPLALSRSLRTSSISRKLMSSEMSST